MGERVTPKRRGLRGRDGSACRPCHGEHHPPPDDEQFDAPGGELLHVGEGAVDAAAQLVLSFLHLQDRVVAAAQRLYVRRRLPAVRRPQRVFQLARRPLRIELSQSRRRSRQVLFCLEQRALDVAQTDLDCLGPVVPSCHRPHDVAGRVQSRLPRRCRSGGLAAPHTSGEG
jgi:hypothetical protein